MEERELFIAATASLRGSAEMPAVMAVFAHPDDETIALGARLARFRNAHLVHVTDGAPCDGRDAAAAGFSSVDAYRDARASELEAALAGAGLADMSRECIGIADEEAAFHLTELVEFFARRIVERRPSVVFTHPYEGGHPDHDACAFALRRAATLLRCDGEPVPMIIEAPFYYAGPAGMVTGCFLPGVSPMEVTIYALSPEEQEDKRALLACFHSQRRVLSNFAIEDERFRLQPRYDFTRPPHPPPVFYDQLGWRIDSQRFCELAMQADRFFRDAATVASCR